MRGSTPLDKKGDVIGIHDILKDDNGGRHKVVAIDRLQGSGACKLESLNPNVEPDFKTREYSRYDLCRYFEIETKAVHEYPPSGKHGDSLE